MEKIMDTKPDPSITFKQCLDYKAVYLGNEEIGHIIKRKNNTYISRFEDWTLGDIEQSEEICQQKILEFHKNPPKKQELAEKPKRTRTKKEK